MDWIVGYSLSICFPIHTDRDDSVQLFLSDPDARFSSSIGWANGPRTGRYAIVVDHGKVTYAQIETEKGAVKVSGAETVLANL